MKKTKVLFQIREFKTPKSYSTALGFKLRSKSRCIKLINRLYKSNIDRNLYMSAWKIYLN